MVQERQDRVFGRLYRRTNRGGGETAAASRQKRFLRHVQLSQKLCPTVAWSRRLHQSRLSG